MLIAFRTTNFRAFRDPQELSLRRARGLRSGGDDPDWDSSISPVAAIYGANASGKSTLYAALEYLHRAVRDSYNRWTVGGSTHVLPFRLDPGTERQPSDFEIEFRAKDGVDYVYGFRAARKQIEAEWLYAYRTPSRTTLFERDVENISFGNTFRGSRIAIDEAASSRKNSLVLSIAAQLGNETVLAAYNWIVTQLRTYDAREYGAEHMHIMDMIDEEPGIAEQLADVLSRADLGIRDLQIVDRDVSRDDMERVLGLVRELMGSSESESERDEEFAERFSRTLQLTHTGTDGAVPFPLSWESEGTRALLSFASIALKALNSGSTIVVDEIDSSLHPLLVAELLSLFAREETNPRQAQLIVTTHDVTLLNAAGHGDGLLKRDQIWLTEKGPDGAASLVALSEYRTPRASENLARGYLTGRYGGIPMLSVFEGFASRSASGGENEAFHAVK
ncbi:AAA family ATPase [Sinomonas sp. G460-2]|uniref:AAA family ATPase n=1 Tax=Sinomonas sp. G460-2 TaxID=3393464 RepID=UPI0039EF5166